MPREPVPELVRQARPCDRRDGASEADHAVRLARAVELKLPATKVERRSTRTSETRAHQIARPSRMSGAPRDRSGHIDREELSSNFSSKGPKYSQVHLLKLRRARR